MSGFINLDLLSVGITTAAIGILGFILFFNDTKNATNRAFLFFSVATIVWGAVNYLSRQIFTPSVALFMVRLALFFAVWHTFALYILFAVFPSQATAFSRRFLYAVIPVVIIVSLLCLSPLVINGVASYTSDGRIDTLLKGPGIIFFSLTIFSLVITGIYQLGKKTFHASGKERKQFTYVLLGTFLTFLLIIVFNFIFPALLDNSRFIAFGSVSFFPFIVFMFYAILKHHLLDTKVISTEIITLILAIVSLIEIVLSKDAITLIFRFGVFILILAFGILLIKSVIREVRQREVLQKLSEELKTVNDKLRVADRMKSQFLSFASHQVKSPMTVVKDYAELIHDGSYGEVPDKVKETAEKIKTVANRLLELVGNLLDLRKLEEGKIEYKMERFDMNALTKQVVDELKTIAIDKHLELSFDALDKEMYLTGDKEKIRQVIQNLIDNSVKYTETGTVRVKLKAVSDRVRLEVSDSGIGIPQDLIPRLFEQFERGSDEAKKIQGTGLGLYIAKQFIEYHHGKVWAESPGPGKGSTFVVELPNGAKDSHH